MKKLLITILAALTFSGAMAQDTAFPDIPAGHWAADAVSRIADLGIVIGFPDGTFRGNESFTRYQSALVVSRLLDVIAADMEAMQAMTAEDLMALRNALQELASDVSAQGARVSALEDSVAQLSDTVAADAARLDALEQAMAGMEDPEMLRDLQNQLAALRTQVDTALARAESAEAIANEALDGLQMLQAQVNEQAAAIAALNELVAILNADLAGLSVPEDMNGDRLVRLEGDVAAIRELVILLRRDQVAMQARLATLEGRVDAQDARISDLDARLTAVEEDLLTLSGSLTLEYRVRRTTGELIDIDRAYGQAQLRPNDASVFTRGADGDFRNVDRYDITPQAAGIGATLNVAFGFGTERQAVGPFDRAFTGGITLNLRPAVNLEAPNGDIFTGYVFSIGRLNMFTGIGGAPIEVDFGEDIRAEFTGYVFNTRVLDADTRSEGLVARIGAPDFLAFLNPTITVAFGSPAGSDLTFSAARLTINPLEGFTLGASYAQLTDASTEFGADPAAQTTVFGVDGNINISILDLDFEFANSSQLGTADAQTLIYVDANVAAGDVLPVINNFRANYRSIPAGWQGLRTGYAPFAVDQVGFGVRAGLSLFIVDVEAFFDSYTIAAGDAVSAFGVGIGADLFAGFNIAGFFKSVSVDGAAVDSTRLAGVRRGDPMGFATWNFSTPSNFSTSPRAGINPGEYVTGFGVKLAHDGAADNALIDGLNLRVQYNQLGADLDMSILAVEASYNLNVSIVNINPIVQFVNFNDRDVAGADSTSTIRFGTTIGTDPLDIFLAPSLNANVNYRSTSHTADGGYTATELQFSVELMLGEFLFDNSTLRARYGSYSSTNVDTPSITAAAGVNTGVGRRDAPSAPTNTNGYELVWNYFGLETAYGVYSRSVDGLDVGAASAFRIRYTVNF